MLVARNAGLVAAVAGFGRPDRGFIAEIRRLIARSLPAVADHAHCAGSLDQSRAAMRPIPILALTLLAVAACGQQAPSAAPAAGETTARPAAATPGGTPPLDAQGVPRFRPGLYEIVQVSDGEPPETSRECLGTGASAELRDILTRKPSPECKISRSSGPAGLQVATECRQNGNINRLRLTLTGGETAYRMTLAIAVTTPNGETSSTESAIQGRWLGACAEGAEEDR